MGCCIAIALVIGVVRTAWFKLFPSRAPVQLAFAPPARRPAPGAEIPAQHTTPAAVSSVVAGRAPKRRGTAAIVIGMVWLVGTELAAHVLHVIGHSDLLHAPGPIAITIGLALRAGLTPARLVPRPHSFLRSGATQ